MGKVFSYDSPVWKFMGRLVDFVYLTLLWVVTSIPLFTIGASTATVYYITLKMADGQEEYLTRMYFKSFARFFREATAVWLTVLAAGLVLAGDFYICARMQSPAAVVLMSAFVVMAIVYLLTVIYVFPVTAYIRQTPAGYIKAAFFLAIRYFGWSLLMLVIFLCVALIGIFKFWPLLLAGVGLTAYLQSLILRQIFKREAGLKGSPQEGQDGEAAELL